MCQVVEGALTLCPLGVAPTPLVVIPEGIMVELPAATIMNFAPLVNVPTYGMCNSPANPVVIAATAAKLGVFTPMP